MKPSSARELAGHADELALAVVSDVLTSAVICLEFVAGVDPAADAVREHLGRLAGAFAGELEARVAAEVDALDGGGA